MPGASPERLLHGVGVDGSREEAMIWIERRTGPTWAVGRAIDFRNCSIPEPRDDDYVFEAMRWVTPSRPRTTRWPMDLVVSSEEGIDESVPRFTEEDLLKPLERWFFGHEPRSVTEPRPERAQ